MSSSPLYADPIIADDLDDCHFYHVMDVPGGGTVGIDQEDPAFDLRGHEDEYVGNVSFAGQRVLEIGPASGFLTFAMERRGAQVVAVELGEDNEWDVVPHAELDVAAIQSRRHEVMRRLRNGFWFFHARTESAAKVHYGDVYALPEGLGRFDTAVLAAVLLHTRDPLRILEGCALRSDRVVITEMSYPELDGSPVMRLYPKPDSTQWDTWWDFTPEFFTRYLEILGFQTTSVTHHEQRLVTPGDDYMIPMFTLVAERR